MRDREGATRAPVHGGSGRDLPAPPARTWRRLARWLAEACESAERQCRVCGCTDATACAERSPFGDLQPCRWVAEDLCSGCSPVHRSAWGVDW